MLIDTVRQTIMSHNLIQQGDYIVLGLSGGPDSVCLFHVLMRLAAEYELTIHPVHINHKFRPGAAEQDQQYVEDLCAKAGLSCHTFVVDVNALAAERGMTSEEAGRQVRYDAFYQVAEEVAKKVEDKAAQALLAGVQPGCSGAGAQHDPSPAPGVRIAVAQNANDQAETILHRILRGTGTDGLSGIAYKRYERGIPVIRPLLDVPRTEIEAYCSENGLDPVTDHTNNEPIYTRNKIRLELLPMLEKYNENIVGTLTRLGRIAAADKEYLWKETERAFEQLQLTAESAKAKHETQTQEHEDPAQKYVTLDRAGLADLPDAIRHRVIAKAFGEIGLTSDISEERLRAADEIIKKKQAPKKVQFPRGYSLIVKQGRVLFCTPGRVALSGRGEK